MWYCKYCGNTVKTIPENHNCPKCEKKNTCFIKVTDLNRNKIK